MNSGCRADRGGIPGDVLRPGPEGCAGGPADKDSIALGFRSRLRVWRHFVSLMMDPEGMHCVRLRAAIVDLLAQWPAAHFTKALDYGCGGRPYKGAINRIAKETVAVDIGENPLADFSIGPDEGVPLPDASVDLAVSFQVLEHVADYGRYLAELARVCKTDAVLVLSAPSVWPYHPHPMDFRRWTLEGLDCDLRRAGFERTRYEPVLNPVSSSFQYLLSVCGYLLCRRGAAAMCLLRIMSLSLNPLIVLSEKFLQGSYRCGAGNYVVIANRLRT